GGGVRGRAWGGAGVGMGAGGTRMDAARMDLKIGDARRAEIESDLWELLGTRRRGASPTRIAIDTVQRLVPGIADDLVWRAELARVSRGQRGRRTGVRRAADGLAGTPPNRAGRTARPHRPRRRLPA